MIRKLCARERLVAAALGAAAAFCLSACAKAGPKTVADISGYAEWERTTTAALDFAIPGHENNHRRIYMNRIGMDYRRRVAAGADGKADYPDGTIVVKEIFAGLGDPGPGAEPKSLDIMVKDRSSAESRGSWVWIIRDIDSGADMVFKGDFCVNCHKEANEKHPYGTKNPSGTFKDFLFY